MSDVYVWNIIILVSVHIFWDLKSLMHVLFMRSKYGLNAGGFPRVCARSFPRCVSLLQPTPRVERTQADP